jgi:hypothetical protein
VGRLVRALKGREKLKTVFWGYCIVGTLAVGGLLVAVCLALMRWDSSPHHVISGWWTGVVFISYFLWAHVSLWMCAFNSAKRGWGYAARCYAIVVTIYYLVGVFASHGPVGIRKVEWPSAGNNQEAGFLLERLWIASGVEPIRHQYESSSQEPDITKNETSNRITCVECPGIGSRTNIKWIIP